ncbi:MAG: hypothetical protein ACE5I7_14670 [Candidatus Binatia bacterium]
MYHGTRHPHRLYGVIVAAAAILFTSALATAQGTADPTLALRQAIENNPATPGVDTALVFTNLGRTASKVKMEAYDSDGNPAGSKQLDVPANGIAYVFASGFADPTTTDHFVGKVEATGRGHLTGTAVLVGDLVTDLPVIVKVRRLRTNAALSASGATKALATRITFPLVAAY